MNRRARRRRSIPETGRSWLSARAGVLGLGDPVHPEHPRAPGPHRRQPRSACSCTGAKLAAFAGGDLPLQDGDCPSPRGRSRSGSCTRPVTPPTASASSPAMTSSPGTLSSWARSAERRTRSPPFSSTTRSTRRSARCRPQTRVWPGHDYGVRPSSTVGDELRTNPFLLCPDFESFLDLKNNWAEYKRSHGIS